MTYAEARDKAMQTMVRGVGEWLVEQVTELERTGLTTEEAQRQFFAAIDRDEMNRVIARRTAELVRVILAPHAPERLQ